jgi:hypothetical protein
MSVEEHLPESASRLDLKLLEEIANVTPSPLVLHGGSGIHPDDLRESFKMNVVKVNEPPGRFGAGPGRSIDGRNKHSRRSTGHEAQESDGNLSASLIVGPLSHAGNLTAISLGYCARPAL